MSGMDMMFKAMGLDPEAMQKSALDFKTAVQELSNDIKIVKEQNAEILRLLGHKTNAMMQLHSVDTNISGANNAG